MYLKVCLVTLYFISVVFGFSLICQRIPSIYHLSQEKNPGDNGFQISIQNNPEKYVPKNNYTVILMGPKVFNKIQYFQRFSISIESNEHGNISPRKVGYITLFGNGKYLYQINSDCENTISETSDVSKTEVYFTWTAPPAGSGCVTFKAMVMVDSKHWYADDGLLSKKFCEEVSEETIIFDTFFED